MLIPIPKYGIGIVTSLVLGSTLEVRCPTLGCLTSADQELRRKSLTHQRSQKDNKSSDNTADGRPTCIYTPTNCTIVHSTADSARDKMPSNWTESSQFRMKILRNARRHNVLKVSPK